MEKKNFQDRLQVALVDCDNFYVSCERVFNPSLKNRPLVILSNNDGCIVARSPEVRAIGVGMGVPYHQAQDVIRKHHIQVLSSNYTLYADMSRRIMETLSQFSTELEYYSIDEAFVMIDCVSDVNYFSKMRTEVLQRTGIPVTIGVAATKTLAKIAAEYAKKKRLPGGIFELAGGLQHDKVLSEILVQEVWGIGVKHAEWLYQQGINTAAQLRDIDDRLIRKRAGIVGLRTVYELRGMRCLPLQKYRPARKNVLSSCSFGRYVRSLVELREAVATYAANTGAKLRRDGSVAGVLSVYITTNVYAKNPQYAKTAMVSLIPPTDCDHELVKAALYALQRIYQPGYRYIKAGVILDELTPASQLQLDFFSNRDYAKCERLYAAVDYINLDHGMHTISQASSGIHRPWAMRQDFKSPRYTTKWTELPAVST